MITISSHLRKCVFQGALLIAGCLHGSVGADDTVPGAAAPKETTSSEPSDVFPTLEELIEQDEVEHRAPATVRMVERLRDLIAKADASKTPPIAPPAKVLEFRQRIALEKRPEQIVLLRGHYGWHLLLDGQSEAALEQFRLVRADAALTKLPPDHEFFENLSELVGLAGLRLGEQQNCIANHTHDSCLLPIQGKGVHTLRQGGEIARREFAQALVKRPDDFRMRWLLNIACMALGDYPDGVPKQWLIPPKAFESDFPLPRFHDVAEAAGVESLGMSGSVILDDFDDDGLLDVFNTDWGIDKQARLFRSKGDGTFEDVTDTAGLEGEFGGLNCLQADYDNDGHLDILILRGAWLGEHGKYPNSLLRNLGDGRFEDVTEAAGLLSFHPTQTGAWTDYDGDGWLDLFIGNETHESKDHPCELYHNNGNGTFTEVASEVGLAFSARVKGASWGDYDNDGRPDLYVSIFGAANRLFHNNGEQNGVWQFEDVTIKAGVEKPDGSFPTWFWDYDHDGWNDILVASFAGFFFDGRSLKIAVSEYVGQSLPADRIALYRNRGDGTFENVAPRMKLDRPLLAMGANFGDLDNDGFFDAYVGTGDPHYGTLVPNRMFRNAEAKVFQDVTTSGGFGHLQKGHGIAFADLDNDGDQDIYADMGGSFSGDVYQNALFENPGSPNHWVTLRLEGTRSNRSAIGARIEVVVKRPDKSTRRFYVTCNSGGSFGASSLQQEIGLGNAESIERVNILWPRPDSRQRIEGLALDRIYHIKEGVNHYEEVKLPRLKLGGTSADAERHRHPDKP